MQFTADTLKKVYLGIENRIKFATNDMNSPQGFDIDCSINAEEFISSFATNQSEEVKYCLAVLRQVEYIDISNGVIKRITSNGYKSICEVLHNVNFKY